MITKHMIAAYAAYAAYRDALEDGYARALTTEKRVYTRLHNKAIKAASEGTTGTEDPVFRARWVALRALYPAA